MEDVLERDDPGESAGCGPTEASPPPDPPPDPLAAARVLLEMAAEGAIPAGPLGPDTVPTAVLELPINLAIEALTKHAAQCRNPLHCDHYPPPLNLHRRMRPETLRQARDRFSTALWKYPDHRLAATVRKDVVEKYAEIAAAIANGTLLRGERLSDLARPLGKDAPRVLAAVLWATRFAGPGAEDLFRLLIPLATPGTTRKANDRAGTHRNGARPAAGDDARVTALRDVNRELKQKLRQAQQSAETAGETVHARETALATVKRDADEARRLSREATARADVLEARARALADARDDALKSYGVVEREANRLEHINQTLRADLQASLEAKRELETQRAERAQETAALRRQLEQSKLQLLSVPTGTNAIWQVLQAEEERLDTARLITSGGARQRADEAWAAHRKLKQAFLEAYPSYTQPRPAPLLHKVPLRLVTLGGSAEIGRSCYLLELGPHRILVDCGIKPSATEEPHPALERIGELHALILTHAHTDHIGWVPALIRRFPDLEIYCSAATAALLPVMLEDCRKHYARSLALASERERFSRTPVPVVEEYDERDMQRVSRRTITCEFGEREILPFGGVSLQFFRAGHILGAASVLVEDDSGRRVFFSGDFSSFHQLTVPAAQWPADLGTVDLLVLESTYGGRSHASFDKSRGDLTAFLRETAGRGGSAILASFALGRAQELLKLLLLSRESGDLPPDVPIFVDGMINRINPIYQRLGTVELSLADVHEVTGEAERREIAAKAQRTPSIIVTTSGMLTGGPVVEYARQLLPDARHRIAFSGYQDEGAPSQALLDVSAVVGPRTVRIASENGEPIEFKAARAAEHVSLSSHADQPGLLSYSRLLNPKHIALVHGNHESQKSLRERLLEIHRAAEIECGPSELIVP